MSRQINNNIVLPMLFKRTGRLIDRHIDQLLKQHSIARSQYRLLYHVARLGEPTQKELIEILEIQAPTLTLIADVLVQKKWLVRVNDTKDRRIKRLRLTTKGKNLFNQVPDPAQEVHKTIVHSLGDKEAHHLENLLGKVISELSK